MSLVVLKFKSSIHKKEDLDNMSWHELVSEYKKDNPFEKQYPSIKNLLAALNNREFNANDYYFYYVDDITYLYAT